nr:replication initiator protein A [Sphingomonas ginsenosidimutans]
MFSVTGANHSARSYARLSEALERLQGTRIKTNIEAGGDGEEGLFSWLSQARLHYSRTCTGERRLKAVKVRLCGWLYRAILRDRPVLDYAAAYFQLGPIERRIYEVARHRGQGRAAGGGPGHLPPPGRLSEPAAQFPDRDAHNRGRRRHPPTIGSS